MDLFPQAYVWLCVFNVERGSCRLDDSPAVTGRSVGAATAEVVASAVSGLAFMSTFSSVARCCHRMCLTNFRV
jgi:hypothetical protein